MAGETLTSNVVNYSGLLYAKKDESTPFLDAVYARGRAGGRRIENSVEFVLANSYQLEDPSQPAVSEQDSLTAPAPKSIARVQESNVVQIFHESCAVSYMKQGNYKALEGVNLADVQSNVTDEMAEQIDLRAKQIKLNLDYTIINGVYQYTKGSSTVAPKTRGLVAALTTNVFDASGGALSKNVINDALMNSIANGFDMAGIELWVNPAMLDVITDAFISLPGSTLPASRTDGGAAYRRIMTAYGDVDIYIDRWLPDKSLFFLNVRELSIVEKPYSPLDAVGMGGGLFYEPLGKTGAAERGQLYGEMGFDYGAEWHHAVVKNLA